MTKRRPNFARILRPSPQRRAAATTYRVAGDDDDVVHADEAEAIVALSWLMACADGRVLGDENAAFAALLDYLAPGARRRALEKLVARLTDEDPSDVEDQVRGFASGLRRAWAREAAYKAAYLLRVWDLETNDAEDALDRILVDALGVTDIAGDLADEVNQAIAED